MLLLKRNMERLSEFEAQARETLGFYGDLLVTVDRTMAPKERSGNLVNLHRRLLDKPHQIDKVHEEAVSEIQAVEESRKKHLEEKDQELARILELLQEASARFRGQQGQYSGRVQEVRDQLKGALAARSFEEMRRRVEEEVGQLTTCLVEMRKQAEAERRQLEAQLLDYRSRIGHLEKKASQDELTGLVNRAEGQARLKQAVEDGGNLSIIVVDMDKFKEINDTHGHHCGDMALRVFSRRIEKIFRATDTVCRWGGDEFLVILPGGTLDLAERRAEQIRHDAGGRYRLVAKGTAIDVILGASTGTAALEPGDSAESLFARADHAMYQKKGNKGKPRR